MGGCEGLEAQHENALTRLTGRELAATAIQIQLLRRSSRAYRMSMYCSRPIQSLSRRKSSAKMSAGGRSSNCSGVWSAAANLLLRRCAQTTAATSKASRPRNLAGGSNAQNSTSVPTSRDTESQFHKRPVLPSGSLHREDRSTRKESSETYKETSQPVKRPLPRLS